jgi:hypothetical protein
MEAKTDCVVRKTKFGEALEWTDVKVEARATASMGLRV